ncbi:MAG: cob(I)yrinic acid a,c-diamide adenosyltransferase [Vallitaleaceae bacterium]|nr:cob(I)yrinic acid a,c-diamide adenosyltransferase [Vallitaleaceae bacterium]
MELGLVQVYCGFGKGKTTAAIGQGIRATGRGLKVMMIQFIKGGPAGELNVLNKLEPDFQVFRFEKDRDFYFALSAEQKEEMKLEINQALKFVDEVMASKACDLLILDEVLGVVENGIISESDLKAKIKNRPSSMELILTGRKLPLSLVDDVDYISEISQAKHPYERGIDAREGIEY